jgi:DNA-binding transcriptional ArsR family regulator
MLSLHQLRCFLVTYEQGSLTAAAEQLGYAQPSVSEQIRALEKSLGATLFRRVGRGVVPTTVADSLRPHAERTLAAAEQLLPRLAPDAGWVSLRPRQFDTLAIVHRAGATLSPAARLMIDLATTRIQEIAEPVHPR